MSGRLKIFDEKEVIDKALKVFWKKGYEASSTEELLSEMGIGKGSFYHSFDGGKKELFEKVLEQFSNRALDQFREKLATSKNPIDEIRNFFRNIAYESKQTHQNGCFLGNAIAELSNIDNGLKSKAAQLLKLMEQTFFDVIKSAQQRGELKTKEDPELLARYLLNLWNGLNITRRMYPDPTVLERLIKINLQILT
jgi:TetR/AcrR family transcriptional repressor of nem operon